jgi:hypothetical protein
MVRAYPDLTCLRMQVGRKHDKQREINFWNYHHKEHQNYLPVVATVSADHRASPRVVLAPVESLLRPW